MISFKLFVSAIQEAIIASSDALNEKNIDLLDQYFTKKPKENNPSSANGEALHTFVPKSVILEYPRQNIDGSIETLEVNVPLITLVPLSMPQIDKATVTAHFKMKLVNNEIQMDFSDQIENSNTETAWGKIELSFTSQETPEDLKSIVERYETELKQQIS